MVTTHDVQHLVCKHGNQHIRAVNIQRCSAQFVLCWAHGLRILAAEGRKLLHMSAETDKQLQVDVQP